MKIIDQRVTLLDPATREEGIRQLKLVEYAGRNCYRSQDKITPDSYQGFKQRLIEQGHHSPLEFAHLTVEIITSRDVMAELTRHRMASFAIQSQRYVMDDKTGDISFIRPDFYVPEDSDKTLVKKWLASRTWEQAMMYAERFYWDLHTQYECSLQDARKVLPNSTATVIVMQVNLRELLHIIELRTSPAAYPEMRTMMNLLKAEVSKVYPEIIKE